jgi:hypothetical protein
MDRDIGCGNKKSKNSGPSIAGGPGQPIPRRGPAIDNGFGAFSANQRLHTSEVLRTRDAEFPGIIRTLNERRRGHGLAAHSRVVQKAYDGLGSEHAKLFKGIARPLGIFQTNATRDYRGRNEASDRKGDQVLKFWSRHGFWSTFAAISDIAGIQQ